MTEARDWVPSPEAIKQAVSVQERRDWLAGMAMQGLLANQTNRFEAAWQVAQQAVEIADAMLHELGRASNDDSPSS